MKRWPQKIPAVQIRWARPTNNLREIIRFYKDGLGLPEIGSSQEHEGYTSIMLGMPGFDYHLEFTEHVERRPLPPSPREEILVFYIPDTIRYQELIERMAKLGYEPVTPENPKWLENATMYQDPESRRVVLSNTSGI